MRSVLIVVAATMAVVGCTRPEPKQPPIIGMSRDSLLACAGIPARTMQSGATEFWEYQLIGDTEFTGGPRNVTADTPSCTARVSLINGAVATVALQSRGNTVSVEGALIGEDMFCRPIFKKCLAR